MKFWWSKRDIPEFEGLPRSIWQRNYRDAHRRARSHLQYWLNTFFYFAAVVILFVVFDWLFPGDNTFLHAMLRAMIIIPPAILVWQHFTIRLIRRHYRHVLLKGDVR